jgi:hypothetical protein
MPQNVKINLKLTSHLHQKVWDHILRFSPDISIDPYKKHQLQSLKHPNGDIE